MIVYRITDARYTKLDGEGARLNGGRWNQVGFAAIYTASSISLAALEFLVHTPPNSIRKSQYLVWTIDIPDNSILSTSSISKFPPSIYGTMFLSQKPALVLKVPSAIIPTEFNYVINPKHSDFAKMLITDEPFIFDYRLIQ